MEIKHIINISIYLNGIFVSAAMMFFRAMLATLTADLLKEEVSQSKNFFNPSDIGSLMPSL